MKILDWFKKAQPKKKDMSDFPTVAQRIEKAEGRVRRMKKKIRKLRETEENPKKLQELTEALPIVQAELKRLKG